MRIGTALEERTESTMSRCSGESIIKVIAAAADGEPTNSVSEAVSTLG